MNYFLDLIPLKTFIEELSKYNNQNNIILNIYIKQLPSMNINKFLYIDIKDYEKIIREIRKNNFKINIVFDTFCLGNKEFSIQGREILETLDKVMKEKPEFVTITNNFYYRYIKTHYENVKLICSEYTEINNVQKINRYLEDLESSGVKLDTLLLKDRKQMKYISSKFDKNNIYINVNKRGYKNNIYKDTLNNNIAHYIQKEEWENIEKLLTQYKKECEKQGQQMVELNKEDIDYLIGLGFNNLWYYDTENNPDKYLQDIQNFLNVETLQFTA